MEAEESGDYVHIIGHVPPDHRECTEAWLFNYIRLMERFGHLIRAQFFGHTHRDEFRLVFSTSNSSDPVAFQFISPSITSYSATNPSYRIYSVDPETFEVLYHETYFFNLTECNERPSHANPIWKLEYNTRDTLKIDKINQHTLHGVLKKMHGEDEENKNGQLSEQRDKEAFFKEYYRRYYVQSEAPVAKSFDIVKKNNILKDHSVSNPFTRSGPNSIIPSRL
jgi:sphingomyelin phosphodiesterase